MGWEEDVGREMFWRDGDGEEEDVCLSLTESLAIMLGSMDGSAVGVWGVSVSDSVSEDSSSLKTSNAIHSGSKP